MLTNREEVSVAGTWGVERRQKFGTGDPASKDIYQSVCQKTYTYDNEKGKNTNKFSKFVRPFSLVYQVILTPFFIENITTEWFSNNTVQRE
jgi:hypothetical protein